MAMIGKKQYRILETLFVVCACAASLSAQNLLAVMDLVSDSSVSKKSIAVISDKISETVLLIDSTYIQFDRSMLPELLMQFNMDASSTTCYDPQCLILIGSLIGANTVVGGYVANKKNIVTIKLNLVDVTNKKTTNTVSMSSRSKKSVLLETELPELVRQLFSPPSEKQNSPTDDSTIAKKTIFSNPLLYVGTVLLGGIGVGGAYYYENYYKPRHDGSDGDPPLSMDDAPVRVRGGE